MRRAVSWFFNLPARYCPTAAGVMGNPAFVIARAISTFVILIVVIVSVAIGYGVSLYVLAVVVIIDCGQFELAEQFCADKAANV